MTCSMLRTYNSLSNGRGSAKELFWTMTMTMTMTMEMEMEMMRTIESSTISIVMTRKLVTTSHQSYCHTRRLCRLHVIQLLVIYNYVSLFTTTCHLQLCFFIYNYLSFTIIIIITLQFMLIVLIFVIVGTRRNARRQEEAASTELPLALRRSRRAGAGRGRGDR